MFRNIQHHFDEDYRNAHNPEYILTASPRELTVVVRELCNEFIETVEYVVVPPLVNEIEKFSLFFSILTKCLSSENVREEKAQHLEMAICTGSLLEATLQMFLLAYRQDYVEAQWKLWPNTDVEKIKTSIAECLQGLVDEKTINSEQKGKILEGLKSDLKYRQNQKAVSVIMLDELIGFCKNQKIFFVRSYDTEPPQEMPGEEYGQMELIRDYRNNIHVFTPKKIPTFDEALQNIRNYCVILIDLITRLDGLVIE